MLIDAHTHAFLPSDLSVLGRRLSLMDAGLEAGNPHKWQLTNRGDLAALVEEEERHGVDRFVLLPVTSRPGRVEELNRWAARAAAENPRLIPFATLHPEGDAARELALALELGLRGVKLHPFVQRFDPFSPQSEAMLREIARTGLPVVLDTLFVSGLIKAKPHLEPLESLFPHQGLGPLEVADLATRHPDLRIIAAHGGSLYGWDRLGVLLSLPNVYFDLAYLAGLVEPVRMAELIRIKGPEMVLFGSDTPWRDVAASLAWFEDLPLTSWEREMVAGGTAQELLRL